MDVDECDSSPCANGAACTESTVESSVSFHAYQCTCAAGFANGVCEYDFISEYTAECTVIESTQSAALRGNCDIDVDECASSPCQNGATCTESTAESSVSAHAYRCSCVAGFANGVCEYGFISEYGTECRVQESTTSTALSGNCDIDVDECASSPCQNDGVCYDSLLLNVSFHAYQCACVAGFANGVCEYDFISEYTAECAVVESDDNSGAEVAMSGWGEAVDGWTGGIGWTTTLSGNCDIDVIECVSSPCQNGATCTESTVESSVSFHAYQCTCAAGFANGVCEYDFISEYTAECTVIESTQSAALRGNCDIDVDECASSPCQNGATCTESTAESSVSAHAYRCSCVAGFANGVCEYGFVAEYTSECTVMESESNVTFSGNCDIDVDECASDPCQNRATCGESTVDPSISAAAYQCTCATGFASGVCDYHFTAEYTRECTAAESTARAELRGNCDVTAACASGPCLNGGRCEEATSNQSAPTFSCACRAGFANATCDVDIDECSSEPCQNGAACSDSSTNPFISAAQYLCRCDVRWAGHDCEIDRHAACSHVTPPEAGLLFVMCRGSCVLESACDACSFLGEGDAMVNCSKMLMPSRFALACKRSFLRTASLLQKGAASQRPVPACHRRALAAFTAAARA